VAEQKKYVRKKILINKRSQVRFTFITILSLLIIGIVLLITIYLPVYFYTYEARDNIQAAMRQIDVYLLEKKIIPMALVYLVFVGLFTILHTHKIFGPVFRFKETLKRMGEGDFSFRIKLRQRDYLKGLQYLFNNFLDTMNSRLGLAKRSFHDLQAEFSAMQSLSDRENVTINELGPALDKIARHITDLESTLEGFILDEKRDMPHSG